MVYTINSPLRLKVNKKIYPLNLNYYRNANHYLNNSAKKKYEKIMFAEIYKLPKFDKIKLEFILHRNNKRRIDRHNVCCIVQKFFCDALVNKGKLIDDNDKYIISEKYISGDIEPQERVEILIYKIE
jgi:hypothetical protein